MRKCVICFSPQTNGAGSANGLSQVRAAVHGDVGLPAGARVSGDQSLPSTADTFTLIYELGRHQEFPQLHTAHAGQQSTEMVQESSP